MKKRRLKKGVLPALYAFVALFVLGGTYYIESMLSKGQFNDNEQYGYVSESEDVEDQPVVSEEKVIIKPYTDEEIKVLKTYYDYKADEASQQNAIILYNNKYMQNTGIAYGGKENFDVVSILDGEVVDVKDDKLLGKVIQIKHSEDVISVYQSLSEITVKKGDTVMQGQTIGKSGTSNISTDLGSHLLFELIIKGNIVNPEDYYNKTMSEL